MDRMPRNGAVQSAAAGLRHYRYAPRPARLSPVQWLISQLVACGLSDKEIAHMLAISSSTVKAHNTKTMRALGVMRRGQLVRYIFETAQFDPDKAERMLADRRRHGGTPARSSPDAPWRHGTSTAAPEMLPSRS
jgi:DNA-binding CsgD family transcriptional regulator